MITPPMVQLLLDAGFTDGWVVADETLILWEHDTEPPAPLVRPTEATDEATTADADTGTDPE
jgi:hypothetical protein